MNFLSHYFTLQNDNPYIILGSIIPDLVTDFSKIYNYSIEDKFQPNEETNKLLLQGIELHMKGDDLFHNHILFDKMQEYAKKHLKAIIGNEVKRKYVIAHVLIEILIDQFLLNKQEYLFTEFYSKMDEIEIEKVNTFFETINIYEDKSNFKKNFTKFVDIKYLKYLKTNEGIIMTLDKVFSKKLKYNFVENKVKWNLAIEEIKKDINFDILILLNDVKNNLSK